MKRNWKNYESAGLVSHATPMLSSLLNVHDLNNFSVQETWNCLEDILVNSIDLFAPLALPPHSFKKSFMASNFIKSKLNKRKRLLRTHPENYI